MNTSCIIWVLYEKWVHVQKVEAMCLSAQSTEAQRTMSLVWDFCRYKLGQNANCSIRQRLVVLCMTCERTFPRPKKALSHHRIYNYHWVSVDSANFGHPVRMTKSGVTVDTKQFGNTLSLAYRDHGSQVFFYYYYQYDGTTTGTASLSLCVLENYPSD